MMYAQFDVIALIIDMPENNSKWYEGNNNRCLQ
jgi:hypothetical protein